MIVGELTLTDISRVLDEPQHRLIYLCEKGVIIPDGSDAKGRGSSRRFSPRNLFEFSVALTLAEFHFPAKITANFLYVVRSFETYVKQSIQSFSIPADLVRQQSAEIIGIVTNGSCLYFSIGFPGRPKNIFGGVEIGKGGEYQRVEFKEYNPRESNEFFRSLDPGQSDTNLARFEINLTTIAQNLVLE